jgi:lipoic acid synthetase
MPPAKTLPDPTGSTNGKSAQPRPVAPSRRLPPWLGRPLGGGPGYARTAKAVGIGRLHTICEEARCPNRGECWSAGTATFLILGDRCTRRCGFCNVKSGRPKGFLDPSEPRRLADAVAAMGLQYAVVTSVDRDDLPDKGVAHWAACIRALRERLPELQIEILTPDFRRAQDEALATLAGLAPLVWGHNVETVPRLYRTVRPGSDYRESLDLLRQAARLPGIVAKSSIMLGLGENNGEVLSALDDLAAAGVQRLTIGQYLRPSRRQLPVLDFVHPRVFVWLAGEARARGIRWVIAAPFARSSYHAEFDERQTMQPMNQQEHACP